VSDPHAVTRASNDPVAPADGRPLALTAAGDPAEVDRRESGGHPLFDGLVILGAAACGLVAAWLFLVAATVVPRQDPSRVGFWNTVGLAFLGFAILTATFIRLHRRSRVATWTAGIVSVGAVVAGGWLAIPMLLSPGHFEGYVVLMGSILAGQGAVVIAHTLPSGRRHPTIA
jgi:hypothetical protein